MRFGLDGVSPERFKLALGLAVLLDDAVDVRAVIGFELLVQVRQAFSNGANVLGAIERFGQHCSVAGLGKLLGEVSDAEILWFVNHTLVGFLDAHDDLDQGCFAHTVAADERDSTASGQLDSQIAEETSRAM